MHHLDLFQSGQIDLENSEKQFEEQEYMLSAFLAQQALEKHVKAYLLKNDIFDNIKKLGHLPLSSVIKNLLEQFKTATKKTEELSNESYVKFFEILLDYSLKLEKNDNLKIIVWKNSLGIPFTTEESNIDQGLITQFDQAISDFKNTTPAFANRFQEYIKLDQLNEINTSELDEKAPIAIDFLNKMYNGLANKGSFSLDDIEQLIHDIGYGSGKNSLSEKDTNNMREFVIMTKSLQWIDETINVFPHQTLARYPFKINDKTNYDLYVEYKDNLYELIKKIKTTCEDIRKTN